MLKNTIYATVLFILGISGTSGIFAQSSSAFYADASKTEVLAGTDFRVEFVMNNIQGEDFKPPVFDNFEVISGPNTTSSYQNFNGRVSQQIKLGYILRPVRAGQYTIGAATCKFNGQLLSTLPFTIKVLERDSKTLRQMGLPTDSDIFVRQELSTDTAYIGEKIELNFKLYTLKDVRSYNIENEPSYTGFFVQNKPLRSREATTEVINGVTYSVQTLEARLLYPQQNGSFTFEPVAVTLGLPDPERSSNYLFRTNTIPFPATTNEATIHIVDLPPNAPPTFTGAVGKYLVQSTVDKRQVTTDDAITLNITVRGNGDPKYLLAPDLSFLKDFDVYEPNIIYEDTHERFGELETIKTFQYLCVPLKTGRLTLQPEFAYFDTEKNSYVTLQNDVFEIEVTKGKNKRAVSLQDVTSNARTLSNPIFPTNTRNFPVTYFGGAMHLSIFTLFIFSIGLILWRKHVLDLEAGLDASIKKKKRAKTVADQRLAKAKGYLVTGDSKAFYDEISKSLLGFIADKINLPASEVSKSNVANRLKAAGIDEHWITEVSDLLQISEMAVFAGKIAAEMNDTYERTATAIDTLNTKL